MSRPVEPELALGLRDFTDSRSHSGGLRALGGFQVERDEGAADSTTRVQESRIAQQKSGKPDERGLRAVTAEYVKGVMIRLIRNRAEAVQRYFPEIASNGYHVTYEALDSFTKDQAEYVAQEMVSIDNSFLYEERKIRNGITGFGRPSLIAERKEDTDEKLSEINRKRKSLKLALADFCAFYGIDNPLA